jgi:predicted nuclease of restriction endonuclease-like (RecB) superfamily
MSGTKYIEEKEFYMALCAREKYSSRELERQIEAD